MKHLITKIILFEIFFTLSAFSQPTTYEISFYPMQVDNQWEFYINGNKYENIYSEKVIDTLRINGNLFYCFDRCLAVGSDVSLREDSLGIYYLSLEDSSEFLLFNLMAQAGDSWDLRRGHECTYGNRISLISNTDTVITPCSTFYNCYHFKNTSIGSACMDAGITDTWITKEVGKIKFIFNSYFGVHEAVLNSYSFITTAMIHSDNFWKNVSYELSQNFPNPFNPTTTINYSIPFAGKVNIKVFDLLGREIAELVNEEKEAGNYSVSFNGKDISSGVYFYNITAGNYTVTKKMILMR